MTDSAARRESIRSAAAAVRAEATGLRDKVVDARYKEFWSQMVFHPLDDVVTLWLGTKTHDEVGEALYLDAAEANLIVARRQLANIKAQVEKAGGPDKVRTVD